MAKCALQLSHLDQENIHLKIQQWQKQNLVALTPILLKATRVKCQQNVLKPTESEERRNSGSNHTESNDTGYIGNDGVDDTTAIADETNCQQHLLWVHQTDWQRDLLTRYGNTISLLDATYKTTCYELQFFVCTHECWLLCRGRMYHKKVRQQRT